MATTGEVHGRVSWLRQHEKHQHDQGEGQAQCAAAERTEIEVAGRPAAVAGPQGPATPEQCEHEHR
ncbi:hypothetical protein D3C81_776960 [compost metagenome]